MLPSSRFGLAQESDWDGRLRCSVRRVRVGDGWFDSGLGRRATPVWEASRPFLPVLPFPFLRVCQGAVQCRVLSLTLAQGNVRKTSLPSAILFQGLVFRVAAPPNT